MSLTSSKRVLLARGYLFAWGVGGRQVYPLGMMQGLPSNVTALMSLRFKRAPAWNSGALGESNRNVLGLLGSMARLFAVLTLVV